MRMQLGKLILNSPISPWNDIGAVGKSAQFPYTFGYLMQWKQTSYPWCLHLFTLRPCKCWIISRCTCLILCCYRSWFNGNLAIIIAIIGGVTACMAALIAFVQNDLKKVLAYSTMSQLAYILPAWGLLRGL